MIVVGSDHAGFHLKEALKQHFEQEGIEFFDVGTSSTDSVDYPLIAQAGCEAVLCGKAQFAILCCGSGVGISIAANKIQGIRAACCSDTYSAKMSRMHNNANVLCRGGNVVGPALAFDIADSFLSMPFDAGERHCRRIKLLSELEKYTHDGGKKWEK